jgi:hypothetical protein
MLAAMVTHFAVANMVRGGWPEVTPTPRWKRADGLFLAMSLAVLPWVLGPVVGIAAAVGLWLGGLQGWGSYVGAVINRGYFSGRKQEWGNTPEPENEIIDDLISGLLARPTAWGLAGLALRGAWWGLLVAGAVALAQWWLGAIDWAVVAAVGLGPCAMPLAFWLGRETGSQAHAWLRGEAFHGAAIGAAFFMAGAI